MLGAGVISPFSSFLSLTGAGLFWELQGLRAGETRLMSPSQEVAQREGSSCGTRGEGRLQYTSDRDKRIPEKDASVSFCLEFPRRGGSSLSTRGPHSTPTQLSLPAAGHPPTRHSIGDPVPDEVSGALVLELIRFLNPLLLSPGQGHPSVTCSQGF